MKREWIMFLRDILDSIQNIEEFTAGMDFKKFAADQKTVSAVIMKLEIIGEAAKNIPREIRQKHKDIPWTDMAGIRDKLIHGYFSIDYLIIWKVLSERLPDLKDKVKRILKNEKT